MYKPVTTVVPFIGKIVRLSVGAPNGVASVSSGMEISTTPNANIASKGKNFKYLGNFTGTPPCLSPPPASSTPLGFAAK
jgi:hypothetical protein